MLMGGMGRTGDGNCSLEKKGALLGGLMFRVVVDKLSAKDRYWTESPGWNLIKHCRFCSNMLFTIPTAHPFGDDKQLKDIGQRLRRGKVPFKSGR